MTFGAPHWLWLLLLGLPIVALYTRRPRRPLVRVPALWLWTAVAGHAGAPSGRLLGRLDERLLALLLFLLALLGTVFGLAQAGDERPPARAVVAVVDVGVAADVRDGAPARPRIERAREALARLEAGLGPDDRRWIVVAGAAPYVLVGPGEPLPAGAPVGESSRADLEGGVALARRILDGLGGSARPSAWLLTTTPDHDLGEDPRVQVVDLRASPGPALDLTLEGTLERVDAAHVRLRTVVENRGRSTTSALIEARLDGAPLVRESPQPIAPGDRLVVAPHDLPCPSGGVIEVRLASGAPDQALSWVVAAPRPLRVALDDPGADRFLRAVLEADPTVVVVSQGEGPVDVVVTTRGAPTPTGAAGVLRVGPAALAGAADLVVGDRLNAASPVLVPVEPGAAGALDLAGLDLEDRLVAAAVNVEAGPGWRALVRAGEGPEAAPLVLVRDDAAREVALTFEPAATDLVLGRAFPLLLARALRWVARHAPPAPRWTRAGEMVLLPARVVATSEARGPDGQAATLAVLPDGSALLRLDRGAGRYVAAGHTFAARPAERPLDDGSPPPATELAELPPATSRSDWAGACVLLALLALLTEAAVFHRRGLP